MRFAVLSLAFAGIIGAQSVVVDPVVYAGGVLHLRFAPVIVSSAQMAYWTVRGGASSPCAAPGAITQSGIYTAPAAVAAPCSVIATPAANTDSGPQSAALTIWVQPSPAALQGVPGAPGVPGPPGPVAIAVKGAVAQDDGSSVATGITHPCAYLLVFRNGLALTGEDYAVSADWATLTVDVAAGDRFQFVCFGFGPGV